ncbi:MAG: pantetheine-phosphate adenylyltransferase [Eubacteriaceae bacterium]|nr:pantetheine-phosphate adenylyltransferase [Eubacteriaceae bacterium]
MDPVFYPGSFDPITYGHIDIIERAIKVFGFVRVVIMDNPKKSTLFTVDERIDLIRECLSPITSNFEAEKHDGLLVDYCEKTGIYTAIRGLRALTDFDYEFQMALTNKALNDKVESVLFIANVKHTFLSSSLVKEIAQFDGDISEFVPPLVAQKLKAKLII